MKFHKKIKKEKNEGVTLIELMIALMMSMLGLSLIITIYLTAQKSYLIQSELSHIQENARLVTALLSSAIQKAGYIGCAKLTNNFPLNNQTFYKMNSENKIIIEHKIDSDAITIRNVSVLHVNLTENMREFSEIYTTLEPRFNAGDILLISDCKTAEIFQVNQVVINKNYQKIIPMYPLTNKYEKFSEMGFLEINTYFIDKTSRKGSNGRAIYALYVKDINNQKMEWAEKVDKMILHFDFNSLSMIGATMKFLFSGSELKKEWYSYTALRDK